MQAKATSLKSAAAEDAVQNYFNYFTEVEERFQQRRGTLLLLSTLDWALIESWRDADVPLAAVLRGIDTAFDRYEARKTKGRARRVNGLAWCAQSVMEAAEGMREATVGTAPPAVETGFEHDRIAAHLALCARELRTAPLTDAAAAMAQETAARLDELQREIIDFGSAGKPIVDAEALESVLRTLEERMLASLLAHTPETELATLREEAARAVAPFRSRMGALQLRALTTQFVEKRLLEQGQVPRLSLFYMRSEP